MGSQVKNLPLPPDVRRVFDSMRWLVRELRLAQNPGGQRTGLSAAQIFVLHVLKEHGALSVGELAEHTATDPSSVSVVVRKLNDKGLVAKEASGEDRRRLEVTLTKAGGEAVARTPMPVQQVLMARMAGMRAGDLALLADLLAQVAPPISEVEAAPMFFQEDLPKGRKR
jgi:DNA-binding MarR family transcriptional regulator